MCIPFLPGPLTKTPLQTLQVLFFHTFVLMNPSLSSLLILEAFSCKETAPLGFSVMNQGSSLKNLSSSAPPWSHTATKTKAFFISSSALCHSKPSKGWPFMCYYVELLEGSRRSADASILTRNGHTMLSQRYQSHEWHFQSMRTMVTFLTIRVTAQHLLFLLPFPSNFFPPLPLWQCLLDSHG